MQYSSIGVPYEGSPCLYDVWNEYLYIINIHFIFRSLMYENIYRSFSDSDIYIFSARMRHRAINTNMEVTLIWFAITGTWNVASFLCSTFYKVSDYV